MKKLFNLSIIMACVMMFFVGCSGKDLSRSEAKKLLEKAIGNGKETGDLESGFVIAGGMPSFDAVTGVEKQITPDVYRSMEKIGLVRLQPMGLVMLGERFIVNFPEEIKKKYVLATEAKDTVEIDGKKYTKDISKVLLGNSSIKEITGIRQEGKETGAKARVEFLIHMELTPFGELMLPKYLHGPIIQFIGKFERYDDGWRLVENGMIPAEVAKNMGTE